MELIRDCSFCESVSSRKDGQKLIICGRFSKADVKNGNDRIYKTSLWRNLFQRPDFQDRLRSRRVLGELGHPDIIETTLTDVSHVVTVLRLEPNGDIYGEAEVLPTPAGNILRILYESGIGLGISSRGYIPDESPLIPEGDAYVIPDSYDLMGFDFVIDPSAPGAFPKIKESSQKEIKDILENSNNKCSKSFVSLMEGLIHSKPITEEKTVPTVKEAAATVSVKEEATPAEDNIYYQKVRLQGISGLDESQLEASFDKAFGEVKLEPLVLGDNILQLKLPQSISFGEATKLTLRVLSSYPGIEVEQIYYTDSLSEGDILSKENKEVENVKGSALLKKYEGTLGELRDRYLVAEEVIAALVSRNEVAEDVIAEMRKRYLKAEKVIEGLRDYSLDLEGITAELANMQRLSEDVIKDLADRYTLSESVIAELTKMYKVEESVIEEMAEMIKDSRAKAAKAPVRRTTEGVERRPRNRNTYSGEVSSSKGKDPAKKIPKGYFEGLSRKYNLSVSQLRNILESVGRDKDLFEAALKRNFSDRRRVEYPTRKNPLKEERVPQRRLEEEPDDMLADVVARQF